MSREPLWDENTLETVYNFIRRVYQGELERIKGIDMAVELTGRSRGSIVFQFNTFEKMMIGKKFTTNLKILNFEIFLKNIERDFERQYLINAPTAIKGYLTHKISWGTRGRLEMIVRGYACRNKIDIDSL